MLRENRRRRRRVIVRVPDLLERAPGHAGPGAGVDKGRRIMSCLRKIKENITDLLEQEDALGVILLHRRHDNKKPLQDFPDLLKGPL